MRRKLQDDYPGWQIWYVFHRDGSATWHGRPNPWLSASSADDLRKLISQANTQTDEDAEASSFKGTHPRMHLGIAGVTECL